MNPQPSAPSSPPPSAVLGKMLFGYQLSFCIAAVARLGVADVVADGARSVEEIARAVGAHPSSLYRVLRALAAEGIFTEVEQGRFARTPLSELLEKGHPASLHGAASLASMMHLRAWPELAHSMVTGATAMEKVFGCDVFELATRDPEVGAAFDEAMTGLGRATARLAASGLDWAGARTIVDLGGGAGSLLAEIVAANPSTRGILFEIPTVCERARATLARAGVAERVEVVSGDFFEAVPAGGDVYVMKWVLHDWDDARALAILKNVRAAMRPGAKLVVLEAIIPLGDAPSPGKLMDVNMLVMAGGRERTEEEFRALLAEGGFRLDKVVPLGMLAALEAAPV